ncbi:TPA: hypothetical protein ACKP89_000502 [Stenotrophomonas maltophilia]|uniref:hypothetical protein n=1 Tax=Stenotrophomonas maltophilia TaxID=40324 RepID=UPI00031B01BF|nr:hypothetical protein [Stenotrophomonas maltophilia]MBA0233599.1 hypothetical protein [Stenotrophomonas maltophilia]MBA0267132.1 hypothetical protein [Stenotrophomonas maltophilia]MBH1753023.1 hypothetical protein [Stenotrophomonas maltophilia]MBH1809674.1 hypothetical protein [Stenotrophomonas maltophilia]MBN5045215.1 hypothetical protein [Stenotrophomonas maltophilia]
MHPHLLITGRLPLDLLLPALLALPQRAARAVPVRRMPARHRTTWAPAGGGRAERARRQRQIEAGTLTAADGLVPTYRGKQP